MREIWKNENELNEHSQIKEKIDFFIDEDIKNLIKNSKINEDIIIKDFIQVGKGALDVIVGGTYQDPIHMFREYISNAVDSGSEIQKITIWYQKEEPIISFYDEGTGMDEEKLLLGLIMFDGDKTHEDDYIGELGIGLYAGGKICEKIRILSKKKGMHYYIEAELPIEEWINSTKQRNEEKEGLLVKNVTKFKLRKVAVPKDEINDHFTNIQLVNLRDDVLEKIESGEFLRELCSILPIDFPPDWSHKGEIDKFLNGWVNHKIKVFFNGTQLFRTVPKITLENPKTYNIYLEIKGKRDIVAKMWVAINPHLHRIGSSNKGFESDQGFLEGMAIRHKNVEIMSRNAVRGYIRKYNTRFLHFFGDCHIVKPRTKYFRDKIQILPQTNRIDFQYTYGWEKVKEQIIRQIETLCKEVRDRAGEISKKKRRNKKDEIDNGEDLLSNALELYENKRYEDTINLLKKAETIFKKHKKDCTHQLKICKKYNQKSHNYIDKDRERSTENGSDLKKESIKPEPIKKAVKIETSQEVEKLEPIKKAVKTETSQEVEKLEPIKKDVKTKIPQEAEKPDIIDLLIKKFEFIIKNKNLFLRKKAPILKKISVDDLISILDNIINSIKKTIV